MAVTTKLLPSRHRGDAELQKALNKVRSVKGKESVVDKMERMLEEKIMTAQLLAQFVKPKKAQMPKLLPKLLPVKTTIKTVRVGDSLDFTSQGPKFKVTKVGVNALHLTKGFSFNYGKIYTMGEFVLTMCLMAQKLPDGSAKVYLTTPGKYAPKN
jgi:hypothetical protein